LLKLQVRVSPGDVVLEPLIEKDVWRTEFPFNDLHNGSYELALFSAKRERHRLGARGALGVALVLGFLVKFKSIGLPPLVDGR
jgi:hypothetical protein